MTPLLLAYPGQETLAENLRRELDAEALAFEMRKFPDGETYLRIDGDVRDRVVVILCTLHEPDPRVLPLIYMVDTLRELGARAVGLAAPYLAYMRQDRRFHAGEAVTSSIFAQLLSAHIDWLVTIDPHLHRRASLDEIYNIPTAVAHAAPLLAQWIGANVIKPFVVGPDAESEQWVRAVADTVPCPYVVLEKIRRGDRDVSVSEIPDVGRWADRTPVLIDDIISSARTMSEAVRQLRAARLVGPVCLGVHGVFASRAYETLQEAGAARVVTTNSIAHASNDIDVSRLLAGPVQRFVSQFAIQRAAPDTSRGAEMRKSINQDTVGR